MQARNKAGHVGYVPEKYLQFPSSNSILSMLQSLTALDSRSHTSSNSTDPELASGSINGDASSKCLLHTHTNIPIVVNFLCELQLQRKRKYDSR